MFIFLSFQILDCQIVVHVRLYVEVNEITSPKIKRFPLKEFYGYLAFYCEIVLYCSLTFYIQKGSIMAKRTGIFTINQVAKRMCKLILTFTPIIRKEFGESAPVMLALEAANLACGVLEAETSALIEYGD